MAKLHLVVADTDEDYLKNMVNFLVSHYSHKFQISYFTRRNYLDSFLNTNTNPIDLLLISPELYDDALSKARVRTCAVLSDGLLTGSYEGCEIIHKYQTGEKLVGSLITVYAKHHPEVVCVQNGSKRTKTMCIYSPVGGAGKTTTAIASAIAGARSGLNMFYLNLEMVPSTSFFFDCNHDNNLSYLIYCLKERSKNLAFKIELTRIIDSEYRVHYFSPPESVLEFEELEPEELVYLIEGLRNMGQYDILLIDMSGSLDRRNIAVLEACDRILAVLPHEALAAVKAQALDREMDIIKAKRGLDIGEKLRLVLNKYEAGQSLNMEHMCLGGRGIDYWLPKVSNLVSRQGERGILHMDNAFGEAIEKIVEDLCI